MEHDITRYSFAKLFEIVKNKILPRHNINGVQYLDLHHFLDRLLDIIVSEYADLCEYIALCEANKRTLNLDEEIQKMG